MVHAAGKSGFWFILGALILIFAVQEWAMRGDVVFREHFDSPASGNAVFNLESSTDLHTLELETSHRVALKWTISDPFGKVISAEYEASPENGSRQVSFVPKYGGTYRIEFGKQRSNHQSPGTAELRVRAGDRRFSKRLKKMYLGRE